MDQKRIDLLKDSIEDMNSGLKIVNKWIYERGPDTKHLTNRYSRNLWVKLKPILNSMRDAIIIIADDLEEIKNE